MIVMPPEKILYKLRKTIQHKCLSYLQDIRRAHVDFGNDDENGNAEGQGEAQMLFGHADDAGIRANHKHTEV